MSLCERFAQASCIKTVNISSLEKEKPYSVIGAERMQTKYGISILLTIKMTSTDSVRVFLPRRFTLIFSDEDIDLINNGLIKINLIFHNICEKTNAYMLSLKPV
jgi:hypothetical protein